MPTPPYILEELQQPLILTQQQIDFFRENKFIKLKQVFSPQLLAHYESTISAKVYELNTMKLPLEQRDTYGKAFLQITNLWRQNKQVKEFVFSKRLARIAAELMGVSGVRIYHDQALYKEGGGGHTPWHADQYYWPLANEHAITAWIPLQRIPLEMGPLEFSAKSHLLEEGRNLRISDDSEKLIDQRLRISDFEHIVEAFELGEISFHAGWLFHRAGANRSEQMRKVMTVIYMEENMKLISPKNPNQEADWKAWCPGAKIGEKIATELNPVLFSKDELT
ncbi:MAG: phytanoyl-CoA dioxygenase family protein [Bacteroidota bacterium]